MNDLQEWARRWGIHPQAMAELTHALAMPPGCSPSDDARSEGFAQQAIRLAAPQSGSFLWRNNVGAYVDERGIPVRYGLANDSKKLNDKVKSSDLIGVCPLLITPELVGRTVGAFAALEVKRPGWHWTGSKREQAQQRFHGIVRSAGGMAGFVRGADEFGALLTAYRSGAG